MEIIEVKDLKQLLHKSKRIGKGSTSVCFLLSNGEVFKMYIDSYRKNKLFDLKNMSEFLPSISELNNDTFIAPEKIYVSNGNIIGYGMRYVKGLYLNKINPKTTIDELLQIIDKVLKDTILVSKHLYRIEDLHFRNILINDSLNIIDLECGTFNHDLKFDNLFNLNMKDILEVLFLVIFKLSMDYSIFFKNPEIEKLANLCVTVDYCAYKELLIKLKEILNNKDLTIRDLRNNKELIIREVDTSDYKNKRILR